MKKYKKKLSLCMIVKNEAWWLSQCLTECLDYIDEVNVVDTGSTDGTDKIDPLLYTRLEKFKWCDDFSAARNFSLTLATGDWILVLDADEVIDVPTQTRLRELIETGPEVAYRFIQRTYTNNHAIMGFVQNPVQNPLEYEVRGYFDTPIVRLIPNNPKLGLRYVQRIHEGIEYTDPTKKPVDTDIIIHHYGYMKSETKLKEKFALYYKLEKMRVEENPNDAEAWRQFGAACADQKQWEKSLAAYEKSIALEPNHFAGLYGAALACMNSDNPDKALEYVVRAKKIDPSHPFLSHIHGTICLSKQDFKSAKEIFKEAVRLNPLDAASLYNLGVAHMAENNLDEAKKIYEEVLKIEPEFNSALFNLAIVNFIAGEKDHAIAILERLISKNPDDANAKDMLGKMMASMRVKPKAD